MIEMYIYRDRNGQPRARIARGDRTIYAGGPKISALLDWLERLLEEVIR